MDKPWWVEGEGKGTLRVCAAVLAVFAAVVAVMLLGLWGVWWAKGCLS